MRETDVLQLFCGGSGRILGGFHQTDLARRELLHQVDGIYIDCPQSASDRKDAGTKPIPRFAFTMGSIWSAVAASISGSNGT